MNKNDELIKRFKEENKDIDEYESFCRLQSNKVLILSLSICTFLIAIIRAFRGEDVRDIIFIFCGSSGIFQLFLSIKTRQYGQNLIIGIVLIIAAIFALIRWVFLG